MKGIAYLIIIACSLVVANCTDFISNAGQKEPESGIYFSAYVGKQGGRPTAFIWSGTDWRCGNDNLSLSVTGATFSGDSAADISIHYQTDTSAFDFKARAVRLPIKIGDYNQLDSANPFPGLFSSYQKPPSPYSSGGNDIFVVKADSFTAYLGWPGGLVDKFSCEAFSSVTGKSLVLGNGWGYFNMGATADTVLWLGPHLGSTGEHLFRLD